MRRVLETCRQDGRVIRLVLGNPVTGTLWLDTANVISREIARFRDVSLAGAYVAFMQGARQSPSSQA